MRDPLDVIRDVLDDTGQDPEAAGAVLAALRDEYGTWRIPSGYLRTDGSEVDGTDVVVPVPAAAEERDDA